MVNALARGRPSGRSNRASFIVCSEPSQRSLVSSAARLLPAPAVRAARNLVLTFGSVGASVNLVQDLLDSGDHEAAIVKGVVGGADTGVLTTIGIVCDEYRRDRQLPAGAGRLPSPLRLSPPDTD